MRPSRNAFTAGMPCTRYSAASARVRVDVDLDHLDLAVQRRDRVLQHRRQLAAGPAPLGPEVDDHRHLVGAVDHVARRRSRSVASLLTRSGPSSPCSRRYRSKSRASSSPVAGSSASAAAPAARRRRPARGRRRSAAATRTAYSLAARCSSPLRAGGAGQVGQPLQQRHRGARVGRGRDVVRRRRPQAGRAQVGPRAGVVQHADDPGRPLVVRPRQAAAGRSAPRPRPSTTPAPAACAACRPAARPA